MELKKLDIKLKFKAAEGVEDGVSEEGVFEAYANIPGMVDYNGEIVDSLDAYQATLDFHEKEQTTIKMLYQHKPDLVIGVYDAWGVDEVGFWVRGRLNRNITLGEEVYQNLKMEALDSVSIGYTVLEEYTDADGIVHLKSLIISEVSVVTFPANSASKITSVKNRKDKEHQREVEYSRVPSWSEVKAKSKLKHGLQSLVSIIRSK